MADINRGLLQIKFFYSCPVLHIQYRYSAREVVITELAAMLSAIVVDDTAARAL